MIKSIIIDDEKKSRETLRGLLTKYSSDDVEIVGEADGYASGIEIIKLAKPDVVFLDIQMPDGSGFKLLEDIGEINFEIVFTTAYDQFAIKAIKYSALDYLLKPIVPEELKNTIEKVIRKKSDGTINRNIKVLLENLKHKESESQRIILSTAEGMHVIDVKNIIRCESDDYYTRFFFRDAKPILVSKTLKEYEELLREHDFIRPHKSHLVNLRFVKSFMRNDGGYIVLDNGDNIPVSRRKRESIIQILHHL